MRQRLAVLAALADGYDLDAVPDVYGDGVVRSLEERVASLLGKPDAAFFPTGTMAQQVALRCWAARGGNPAVGLHPLAHPVRHERHALTTVAGLRTIHLTAAPRPPTAAEIRDADEPFGMLMLELPLRDAGFLLPTWDELCEAVTAGRDRGAIVHLDGARLWECPPHFGQPLETIAALADSVYVSFYKSLGGLSGAALAGPADFIAAAKAWRHRYGGLPYQQFPAALAALDGLDTELPRLASYVAHAKVVAAALRQALAAASARAEVPWFRILPEPPHTHQFAVWLPYPAQALTEASLRLEEETRTSLFRYWADTELPDVAKTEVQVCASALDWSAADIAKAVATFLGYLALPGRRCRPTRGSQIARFRLVVCYIGGAVGGPSVVRDGHLPGHDGVAMALYQTCHLHGEH